CRTSSGRPSATWTPGSTLGTSRQTVGAFLDRWIADVVTPARAPKTTATYRDVVRLHLKPTVGHHALDKLTPQHVAALLKAKTDDGLSPRMVHHIRGVLRNALNQAMRWGMVVRNVATLVEAPRQVRHEVQPLTLTETRAMLAAVGDDRLAALFRLALTLGLRQGEVLGLQWDDLDLDRRTLKVRRALQRIDGHLILKEPKSAKSRRTVTLPPFLVADLRAHRVRQLEERMFAGPRWQDAGFVFTSTIGTPLDARNVIRSWHRLQLAHGQPRREFHVTRHTAASLMLAEGVPVKVVQEVLGHSLMSTTADIYGHLFPEAFDAAADAMERALAG
ncbi:MAG: site-specific integrase, partial [Chloroflexota bacterium]|nr:site-specific integrase [Chloroflexota bacterium]